MSITVTIKNNEPTSPSGLRVQVWGGRLPNPHKGKKKVEEEVAKANAEAAATEAPPQIGLPDLDPLKRDELITLCEERNILVQKEKVEAVEASEGVEAREEIRADTKATLKAKLEAWLETQLATAKDDKPKKDDEPTAEAEAEVKEFKFNDGNCLLEHNVLPYMERTITIARDQFITIKEE